jgi:hypothetical protein
MADLIEEGKEKGKDTAKPYKGVVWAFLTIVGFLILMFLMILLFGLTDSLWFTMQA